MPDPFTCILVYLLIGSLIWLLIDACGQLEPAFAAWAARDKPPSVLVMGAGMALMILLWPRFLWAFVAGKVRGRR